MSWVSILNTVRDMTPKTDYVGKILAKRGKLVQG